MREAAEHLGPLPLAMTERRADEIAPSLYDLNAPIRFVEGPHLELFDARDRRAFVEEVFEVSPRSDRMGYRLAGAVLASGRRGELASTAVLAGTVQVPPGGEPIVLMADRQTTGGYPMMAQVVTAQLPVLAQLRPGDRLRFAEATVGEAQSALRAREKVLRGLTF
jgi:antagonist of KipI